MASPRSHTIRPITRGDIVLALFPFTDLSTTKRRPAVVLWADPTQTDFTLCFIGSRRITPIGTGEIAMLPTHPEFSLTGLSVPSKIHVTKLVTVSRDLLRRWLGRLGPLLTANLDHALVTMLSINTVPYREEGRKGERARMVALHRAGGSAALVADLEVPTHVE
jgi:mRNA interferase MazF